MNPVDSIIEEYKLKLNGLDPASIQFEKDLAHIELKEGRTDSLHNIAGDFSIVHLEIDAVISKLHPDHIALTLRAGELIMDQDMMHLIDYVKSGAKLIPPILYTVGDTLAIFDGKQQISLCKHFNIQIIPFLVRNLSVDKVQSIVGG